MIDHLKEQRSALPDGYEIVPVALLELLADAAHGAYDPAFGGNASHIRHAGVAASNILARYWARKAAP